MIMSFLLASKFFKTHFDHFFTSLALEFSNFIFLFLNLFFVSAKAMFDKSDPRIFLFLNFLLIKSKKKPFPHPRS